MKPEPTDNLARTVLAPTVLKGHIPVLDGLRGLAVLAVLIFHFTGGASSKAVGFDLWSSRVTGVAWCGVDLFFVLSGFLITGILADTKGTGGYLRNFYARRALRIFPLYFGALLLVFVLLPHLVSPYQQGAQALSEHQAWLWSYTSNIGRAVSGDVFHAGLIQMDHFWSLAVEEQFYLVWPMLVLWLGRTSLIRLCLGCILVSPLLRIALSAADVPGLYTLTPCRLDGLMVGALIALGLRSGVALTTLVPVAKKVGGTCALVLAAVWCVYGIDGRHWTMQTGGFSLLAGLFGSLLVLVLAAPKSSRLNGVFNSSGMRFLGKYSYGLYVWHYLLLPTFCRYFSTQILIDEVFGHYWPARLTYVTLSLLCSVAVAWCSWHVFEKHFLHFKRFFEARPTGTHTTARGLSRKSTGGVHPAIQGALQT